jgi:cytidine deaminase
MKKKEATIAPLDGPLDDLAAHALAARKKAYAPYSSYQVGSALRTADGRTYLGTNVENASYGLSLCAERAAVSAAVLGGAKRGDFAALVVVTSSSPPAAPCGMCLQTLAEFAEDLPILLLNEKGERRETRLGELLPFAFRERDLSKR